MKNTYQEFSTLLRSIKSNSCSCTSTKEKTIDAICDISGKDSIAACVTSAIEEDFEVLLPVVVRVPTEFGDFDLQENVEILKQILHSTRPTLTVLDTIYISADSLWWLLNGRFVAELIRKFGFYSPCPGCHLLLHSLRSALASTLKIKHVISGERIFHGSRQKINQLPLSLQYYQLLMSWMEVRHLLPIKDVINDCDIENILGRKTSCFGQKRCVFSSNYYTEDGRIIVDSDALDRYFSEFALPFMKRILKMVIDGINTEVIEEHAACFFSSRQAEGV
ncbi:hypothetical protein [Mesotoga sp.]|uniref:hypothetical protein n=1 Tax=Mesotoga sp. TaxID=2053577 RepID=UPI001BD24B3F|nr:hypothetical protein [Mesotoga sp.]